MVYTFVVHCHANADPSSVDKLKAKLAEAASIYRKDQGTINWYALQDEADPRKFSVVERFENKDAEAVHLANPYWPGFMAYVEPLLDEPMDIRRNYEVSD